MIKLMKRKSVMPHFLAKSFGKILLMIALLGWSSIGSGQQADRLIFADWVGLLPTQGPGDLTLFQYPQFQKGLEQVIPPNKWQEILRGYDFNRPVEEVGEWLVIIGQHHYQIEDDIVIFLSPVEARIEAVCQSYLLSVWYVPMNWDGISPYQVASSPASTELTYYLPDGKQVHRSRPVGEGCANNDAKLAVKRLKEATQQQ